MSQDYLKAMYHSVSSILSDYRPFYIPIFQRPYSWTATECQKLWEDLVLFYQEKSPYKFQLADAPRYFLGALVVFQDGVDAHKRMSVIDGQQRITTLMLLLKAFHDDLNPVTDRKDPDQQKNKNILERIEKLLWVLEWDDSVEENVAKFDQPILSSDAIDEESSKADFLNIITTKDLQTSQLKVNTSLYVSNYCHMRNLINKAFSANGDLAATPKCRFISTILDCCTFLFIKTNAEEDALRIFNTLNNRGMQLLDADILKSQLYEVSSDKAKFKSDWATFVSLSKQASAIIRTTNIHPLDEMFRMLMMWVKSSHNNIANDIQLRTYFEKNAEGGSVITGELLSDSLIPLAAFFAAMSECVEVNSDDDTENLGEAEQEKKIAKDKISEEAMKWLHVISCFSKNMYWRHIVSVYYLKNKEMPNFKEKFEGFIKKAVAFNILYVVYAVPFSNIRKKAYEILVDVYNNGDFDSNGLLKWSGEESIAFDFDTFAGKIEDVRAKANFSKGLTLLHAYLHKNQVELIPITAQVEHIFPKSWEKSLSAHDRTEGVCGVTDSDFESKFIEKFGNKVMCEAALNNGAKDSYFDRKAGIYQGAFSSKYKGAIELDENGNRKPKVPETEKNALKKKASEIAEIKDVCYKLSWGKAEIECRDVEVKKSLFKFFKETLGL